MDTTYQTIHIDDHKLAYQSLGGAAGTPIILLHGLLGSIGFWHDAALYRQYGPVYTLALPGHFPAVAPASFSQQPVVAKALGYLALAAIDQLVPDGPVTVIGHSTGGLVGLAAAMQSPRITRLITVGGFAQGDLQSGLRTLVRLAEYEGAASWLFSLAFWPNYSRILSKLGRTRLLQNRRAVMKQGQFAAAFASDYAFSKQHRAASLRPYFRMMPQLDIRYRLPRIAAATLAITGDQDPIVPPVQSQQIADRVPNSQLAVMTGAGHYPMWEQPEAYAEQIHRWLSR